MSLRDTAKLLAFNTVSRSQQEIAALIAQLSAEREKVSALQLSLQSVADGYVQAKVANKQLLDDLQGLVALSPWAPQ